MTALMVLFIGRETKRLPSFSGLLPTGGAGLLMYAALSLLPFLDILSMIVVGAVLYAGAAYALGAVSREEMQKLLQKRA